MADPHPNGAVVDASALVDLLAGTDRQEGVRAALAGKELHAPAHLDVEVLSALARLQRAGMLAIPDVDDALQLLATAPIIRHELTGLLADAWALRDSIRVTDALYVALADGLDLPLLTTDRRLARARPRARVVEATR